MLLCHCADCHYAGCHILFIGILNVVTVVVNVPAGCFGCSVGYNSASVLATVLPVMTLFQWLLIIAAVSTEGPSIMMAAPEAEVMTTIRWFLQYLPTQ
jgi:hypothetical protein